MLAHQASGLCASLGRSPADGHHSKRQHLAKVVMPGICTAEQAVCCCCKAAKKTSLASRLFMSARLLEGQLNVLCYQCKALVSVPHQWSVEVVYRDDIGDDIKSF